MSTLMNEALKELERRREQKDGLTGFLLVLRNSIA